MAYRFGCLDYVVGDKLYFVNWYADKHFYGGFKSKTYVVESCVVEGVSDVDVHGQFIKVRFSDVYNVLRGSDLDNVLRGSDLDRLFDNIIDAHSYVKEELDKVKESLHKIYESNINKLDVISSDILDKYSGEYEYEVRKRKLERIVK